MKCICQGRVKGDPHTITDCPARDTRVRVRDSETRAKDNARRVVIRTDHTGLREQLPRLGKATPEAQDAVVKFIKKLLANDGKIVYKT